MNAPRPDLSKIPESRSLILDGRTWAEVCLSALGENFHAVQQHVGRGITICAVVKADGYGHGAVECARALAYLRGRHYVLPEDVTDLAPDVFRHRLVLTYEALADAQTPDWLIERVMQKIAPPEKPLQTHVRVGANG